MAVILVVIVILLLLRCCGSGESIGIADESVPLGDVFDLSIDEDAGKRTDVTQEEVVEELNRKVSDGMITISMNLAPVFTDGRSKGNLLIVNEESNNYPQIVYIVRKDTGVEIYRSGGIPVGSKIERAKLAVDLPAGTYECVAYFNNADPETGAFLGTAGAEITVTVQH